MAEEAEAKRRRLRMSEGLGGPGSRVKRLQKGKMLPKRVDAVSVTKGKRVIQIPKRKIPMVVGQGVTGEAAEVAASSQQPSAVAEPSKLPASRLPTRQPKALRSSTPINEETPAGETTGEEVQFGTSVPSPTPVPATDGEEVPMEEDKPAMAPTIGTVTVATPIAVGKDEKVAIPAYLGWTNSWSVCRKACTLRSVPWSLPFTPLSWLTPIS